MELDAENDYMGVEMKQKDKTKRKQGKSVQIPAEIHKAWSKYCEERDWTSALAVGDALEFFMSLDSTVHSYARKQTPSGWELAFAERLEQMALDLREKAKRKPLAIDDQAANG